MKKRILSIVLCLVMVFSLLPFTASAASSTLINEETFPDPVFREYVLKIVGSSVLTEEKAQQIEVLDVSKDNIKKVLGDRAPITSLMGIRYLRYVKDLNCSGQELKKTLNLEQNSRVEKLNCSGNQLTDLWFHKGSSLRYLDCSVNQFTALNLSKNPELTELSCSNNKLTSLDLSANTKLQEINASSNKLTALDVRQLPELTHLYLWGNHDLKSIDVSKNTKLEFLSVSHCKLTALDVSHNRKLVELFVYNNQLTALDVRSNYMLKTLYCYENQITALDLSSNVSLEDLGVNDNPITELNLHPLSNLQKLSCSKMQLKKLDVDRCPKLRRLYCNDNQIETLDLRSNKKLETLYCQNNRLSWLNLSSNTALDPRYVDCSGNVYDIKVDENLQYKVYPDLPCYGATEGTYFTAARASDWTGGTVSKVDGWDVLTLDNRDVKEVTYKYDTGNAKIGKVAFTLKTEVPAKYITISFDPNGGTGTMKPMRVKAGVGYTLPECTFTPPEGKEFAGWLAVNGNVYPAGHDVFSTYDQSLKATWKDKEVAEVTISFDPNGGTGTMQPMKVKSGENFTLPECTFTPPEGKEFAGWLAANGTVYPAGDIAFSTTDTVLKATWKDKEAAEITISFDPNGGTGTMQPMKVKSGENFMLPECTFTPPEGKEFAGWLAVNGTVYPAGDIAFSTTDSVLKATWKDKEAETPHKHSYKAVVTAPTCTEKGYTTHTCACGDSYVDTYVDALGHAWDNGKVTKEPTETETGVKTFTCTRCGETKTETIPKLTHEHSYKDVVTAPTCTAKGYTTHTCACGDSYVDTYVDALGHAWDSGKVTKQPTATEAGIRTYTCTRCGETKTETISATGCPSAGFTDVPGEDNWAHAGIDYCVANGLMSGIGNNLFGPKLTTTRAQIVQILYNLEGEPKVSGTTPFTDLTQDWYQDAVLWAYQTGVVAGTSSTTFEPDRPVTREQIAVILMEYVTRVLKLERTWTPADLSAFPDADSVSDWAKDAMADAVGLGLISGASNGGQTYLEPQGSATREQVATILMEFCKNVKK